MLDPSKVPSFLSISVDLYVFDEVYGVGTLINELMASYHPRENSRF